MTSAKMTADDENDHLWRYLNRVSLQLISLLDLDRGNQTHSSSKLANASKTDTRSALKSTTDTSKYRPEIRGLVKRQPARKTARAKRGQQQQRPSKRNTNKQQRLLDSNTRATTPPEPFSSQFKRAEDEKLGANEQQQPMSSGVLGSDQTGHEHYISATEFNPHHNHLTSVDCVEESIIQLDANGNSNLSSVGLLTLTIPDDNLSNQHQHSHNHSHHNQHHHHHHQQQLDPGSHSAGPLQNGGSELISSPTTIGLSPGDPSAVQLGGASNSLGPLQVGSYYTVSSLAYDDFVGHHGHHHHHHHQHHQHQNGTSVSSQGASSQTDSATDHQTSPSHQYQQTGDQLGQSPLTECYSHLGQSLHHHNPTNVHHHHYQHNQFEHQVAISHHELQQQQQQPALWLNQPIVGCGDSSAPTALSQQEQQQQHHHSHLAHRQPVDQHDVDYDANPNQAYQQQHYPSRPPHLVDHHNPHQHHVNEHPHHQGHHSHEHQLHNDNNNNNNNNQHHLAIHHHHMTPPLHHIHSGHLNHHHHHHHGHLIPPLGPLVNGIECSSVILHDINLASASWSSPEDLYSI